MKTFGFSKSQHLRSQADFKRVYDLKCKAADGVLLVFVAINSMSTTRIGLSVSKKHGGAVVRNRLKRLLREAFRLSQHDLPAGVDLIAIPLAKERATLEAYRDSLTRISRRLVRRCDPGTNKAAER